MSGGGDHLGEGLAFLQLFRETSADADEEATRNSLSPNTWDDFCKNVGKGKVEAMCVVDFPYADEGGLNLKGGKTGDREERLLERMYVFKDVTLGEDTRVVLHVHTLRKWVDRGAIASKDRADKMTSANVRIAEIVDGEWKQGKENRWLLPVSPSLSAGWRVQYNAGVAKRAMLEWQWACDKKGDWRGKPPSEDGVNWAVKYDQVRTVIKLGESLLRQQHGAVFPYFVDLGFERLKWKKNLGSDDFSRGHEGGDRLDDGEIVGDAHAASVGTAARAMAARTLVLVLGTIVLLRQGPWGLAAAWVAWAAWAAWAAVWWRARTRRRLSGDGAETVGGGMSYAEQVAHSRPWGLAAAAANWAVWWRVSSRLASGLELEQLEQLEALLDEEDGAVEVHVNETRPDAVVESVSYEEQVAQGAPLGGAGESSNLAPDALPAVVKVLFVGANKSDAAQLQLNTERDGMAMAYFFGAFGPGARASRDAVRMVEFESECFSGTEKVATRIATFTPTVVQFACHGEAGRLYLASGPVDDEELVCIILTHNEELSQHAPEKRIRLVIVNACMSAALAAKLARGGDFDGRHLQGIEFVIGHGIGVKDVSAVAFSSTFYQNLGIGLSLFSSFGNARPVSIKRGGYHLFAERSDARHLFVNPGPAGGQSGAKGSATLAAFLNEVGFRPEADVGRLCEAFGVARKDGAWFVPDAYLDTTGWHCTKPQRGLLPEHLKAVVPLMGDRADPGGGGESSASGDDTDYGSEEESEEEQRPEVVACFNQGDPRDLREHMSRLLRDFVSSGRGQGGGGLTFCSLLLLCFMRTEFGLFAKRKATFLDAGARDALLACERGNGDEASVRTCFALCMERARTGKSRLKRWGYEHARQRDGKASELQLVVDCGVKKMLPAALRGAWSEVGQSWHQGSAQAFADRANTFLATHVTSLDGAFKALGDAGEQTVGDPGSGSVAFLLGSSLTALLFFEYLRVRKRRHEAGGAGAPLSLEGFRRFVGSSRARFGVDQGALPDEESLGCIFEGLLKAATVAAASLPDELTARLLSPQESPLPPAVFAWEEPIIRQYLAASERATESIPDAGTGKDLLVRDQCVTLRVVEGTAVQNFVENGKKEWYCRLSEGKVLMQDPVMCSDGITYDRAKILARLDRKSPVTGVPLVPSRMTANLEMKRDIEAFKARVLEEQKNMGVAAEGSEEHQLFLRRRNYSGVQPGAARGGGQLPADLPDLKVLEMVRGRQTRAVCITGPPASGKTISMLRIATEAARAALDSSARERESPGEGVSLADNRRIPLFLRASELSQFLNDSSGGSADVDLVELFVKKKWPEPRMHQVLLRLYDLGHLLPIVDGLDEGAGHRKRIEDFVSEALERRPGMGLIVSTREKHFDESRRGQRLEAFKPAQIQPLDEQGQDDLISYRVEEARRGEFKVQLDVVAKGVEGVGGAPELVESPFLLTLLTNLFNKEGRLPSDRTGLYELTVRSALKHFFASREEAAVAKLGLKYEDLVAVEGRSFEFLRTLAFVCHSDLRERDFQLNSEDSSLEFRGSLAKRWKEAQTKFLEETGKAFQTSDMEKWLLPQEGSCVSLLVCTSESERTYRFGHLTFQEFLAASFVAHLKKPAAIWAALHRDARQAINAQWNREVLFFSAGMMDEDTFVGFAKLLVGKDDGSGVLCALVKELGQRRGPLGRREADLRKLLEQKFQEIRSPEAVALGLCHPSQELRRMVLSELNLFQARRMTLAVVRELVRISQDRGRGAIGFGAFQVCAALLSLAQLELDDDEMEDTRLSGIIRLLSPSSGEQLQCAASAALGTILERKFGSKQHDKFSLTQFLATLSTIRQKGGPAEKEVVQRVRLVTPGFVEAVFLRDELAELAKVPWLVDLALQACRKRTGAQDSSGKDLGLEVCARVRQGEPSFGESERELTAHVLQRFSEKSTSELRDLIRLREEEAPTGKSIAPVQAPAKPQQQAAVLKTSLVGATVAKQESVTERLLSAAWEGLDCGLLGGMTSTFTQEDEEVAARVLSLAFGDGQPIKEHVLGAWRRRQIGRFIFSHLVKGIRHGFQSGAMQLIHEIHGEVRAAWEEARHPESALATEMALEAAMLLKELDIGLRESDAATWSGSGVLFSSSGAPLSADIFGVERPDPSPSPFTVLFVGANVEEQTELRVALTELMVASEHGQDSWKELVKFEHSSLADANSIVEKIVQCEPTVLVFSCHGELDGAHLKGGCLHSTDLADAILAVNTELGARRIRLVVATASMSGELARSLSEGIDFVVWNGDVPGGDDSAIDFSSTLFRGLGHGLSLLACFKAARLSSKHFQLLSPRFDPQQFVLQWAPPEARGRSESGPVAAGGSTLSGKRAEGSEEGLGRCQRAQRDLVTFLVDHKIFNTAVYLQEMGVESLSDLAYVEESDLADTGMSLVQRRRLITACGKAKALVAAALSRADYDEMSRADYDDSHGEASSTDAHGEASSTDAVFESDNESHSESVVVAARNEGDFEALVGHMQQLAIEFKTDGTGFPAYTLLLVEFMQGATFPDSVDKELCCPITGSLMEDPVRCSDGFTYERRAIMVSLESSRISPMTREVLDPSVMMPNEEMRLKIQAVIQDKREGEKCEREWRHLTNDADAWFLYEDEILACFDRGVSDARFRHPWLDRASFSSQTCSPHIFVIDLMVRRMDPRAAGRWDEEVVRSWDEVSADPRGFLERANMFLREGMDGVMRGGGVATQ